jgi:hypothetical protein
MNYYLFKRSSLALIATAVVLTAAPAYAQLGQSEWQTPGGGTGQSDWQQPGQSSGGGLGQSGWQQPGQSSGGGLGQSGWQQPGQSSGDVLGQSGWQQPGSSAGNMPMKQQFPQQQFTQQPQQQFTQQPQQQFTQQPQQQFTQQAGSNPGAGWTPPAQQQQPQAFSQAQPQQPAPQKPVAIGKRLPTNQPDWVPPNPVPTNSNPSTGVKTDIGADGNLQLDGSVSANNFLPQQQNNLAPAGSVPNMQGMNNIGNGMDMSGMNYNMGGMTNTAVGTGPNMNQPFSGTNHGGMGSMGGGMGSMGNMGGGMGSMGNMGGGMGSMGNMGGGMGNMGGMGGGMGNMGGMGGLMGGMMGGGASGNPLDAIGKAISGAASMGLLPGAGQPSGNPLGGLPGFTTPVRSGGGGSVYTQRRSNNSLNNVPGVKFGKTVAKTTGNSVNRQIPRVINATVTRGIRKALYGW